MKCSIPLVVVIGTLLLTLAGCLAIGTLAGCDDRSDADRSMDRAGDKIENAADKVGDAAKDAADNAGDKLENAGDKLKD